MLLVLMNKTHPTQIISHNRLTVLAFSQIIMLEGGNLVQLELAATSPMTKSYCYLT